MHLLSRRAFSVASLGATFPLSLSLREADARSNLDQGILIVVGPSKHPPGTHEVEATSRLLKHCIEQVRLPNIKVDIVSEWPVDSDLLNRTSSIVFVGDLFPPARMEGTDKIMNDLAEMMNRGCGMVCVHYATGLSAQDVPEDGQHPLLQWIGGYFATKCKHHQSVAKVFEEATIVPCPINHEVLRGWKSFTIHDEPYINNYFGKSGMGEGVVALATSALPPENPKEETVAWAIERPDGGRGVGIVMPHFFRNWKQPEIRKMILNSIVWSAKFNVPENGIDVGLPELSQFTPTSVEPIAKKK